MATRTQKAAAKKKAEQATVAPPEASKPDEGAKPKPGKAKPKGKADAAASKPAPKRPSKPAKKGKGGKKGKGPLAFEEVHTGPGWPQVLDTVRAKQPGFFERLRQRRAENAARRAEENKRREAERIEARERQRKLEVEQRVAREAQEAVERAEREVREAAERAQRAEQEKAALAQQKADERKMKAAMKRAETRAAKEAEREEAERRAAEEAAARAIAAEEAKARRAAERQRKREELEAEERRKADEQAAKDAEAEVEARRLAANKRFHEEEKARLAAAKELEPDLEFEEASKPVKDSDALVPAKGAATAAEAQADLVAAELAKRRSKPVVVIGDIPEPPKIPKAPLRPGETFEGPPTPVPPPASEAAAAESQPTDTFGFSIPEAFLLLANGGGWDERAEKNKEGFFGGALAGAMVLELLMRGQVIVQRDRIVLTGEPTDDEALAPIVARLRRVREKKGDLTSLQQMGQLAKANRDLLTPFKQRLADKGLVTYGSRKHLGLFHRSWVEVSDDAAQERLQNRLRRAIAGGGTPEAASILLLGLLDASGLFDTVVPDEAADYNRKRLNGLLGGRDIMGYKVDPQLKALQEIATRSVLNNVRVMTVRG